MANVGDTVQFTVSGDFASAGADLLAGGSIDFSYGPGLAFADAAIDATWDPAFSFGVGDQSDGTASYVFGTFTGVATDAGIVDIMTISFNVLGNGAITMSDSAAPGATGWLTFSGASLAIDYGTGAEVVVPVPAAVWFMLSGLGALLGFRRSRA